MEITIVQKSLFGRGSLLRLDAEYVRGSDLTTELSILKYGATTLEELTSEYVGPRLDEDYASDEDIIDYIDIDAVDTADGLTFSDQMPYGLRPSRAKYEVSPGDILISNVRPERGVVAYVTERLSGKLASSGFTLLQPDASSSIPQQFIYAFLRSSYGRRQLVRRARGSMYPAVLGRDVGDIAVPDAPGRLVSRVVSLIDEAFRAHDEFFLHLTAGEQKMDSYIRNFGSPPGMYYGIDRVTSLTTVSSGLMSSESGMSRMDAEFFRGDYDEFARRIVDHGDYFPLGKYYDLRSGRIGGNDSSLVPTIKQAVLTNAGVNWSAVAEEPGEVRRGAAVEAGDILLAATAHEIEYVGKKVDYVRAVPVDLQLANQAVADVMILKPRQDKPESIRGSYVAAFLRHDAGKHQVQRCIRGLRGGHVYARDLAIHVLVPVPDSRWLNEFEALASEAELTRNKAKTDTLEAVSLIDDWLSSSFE